MNFGKAFVFSSVFLAAGWSFSASAGTVAQFNFDATNTDSATLGTDISGNGHDLTWGQNASVAKDDNPFRNQSGNNSVNVSGKSNGTLANLGKIDLAAQGNQFTIEGWIKPTTHDAVNWIAQLGGKAGGPMIYIYLGMTSAAAHKGDAIGDISTGGTHHQIYSDKPLVLNEWNYLALTYDGHDMTLYVLNKNSPTPTSSSVNVSRGLPSKLTNCIVASNNSDSDGVSYDDIRISDTALSDAELGYHKSFTGQAGSKAEGEGTEKKTEEMK